MKIGIAMATFNGAAYVEAQLASIARQDRRPDHVVVADDGSSDETVAIVERVCAAMELPLTLMRSEARLGVTANFERAIAKVDGDVVVLCDQDDVWRADKLSVVARAMATGVGGVFSDARVVNAAGEPAGKSLWASFGYNGEADLLPVLLKQNVVTGATLAFAASLRDLVLPINADGWHDVWIALLLAGGAELQPLPEALVDYRVHVANAVGLGTRDAGGAVTQRRGDDRKQRELRQFEAIAQRLHACRPDATRALSMLDDKVAHLRHRCSLPTGPMRRAARIGRLLPEYARFSSGWKSPVLDLVAPARKA